MNRVGNGSLTGNGHAGNGNICFVSTNVIASENTWDR